MYAGLVYPASQVPAEMRAPLTCALQSAELTEQVAQAPLPAAILYSYVPHEVQVAPPSGLVYPALQVPADVPPHPVLLDAHVAHAKLPAGVLYLPDSHVAQVKPLSLLVKPGEQSPITTSQKEISFSWPVK